MNEKKNIESAPPGETRDLFPPGVRLSFFFPFEVLRVENVREKYLSILNNHPLSLHIFTFFTIIPFLYSRAIACREQKANKDEQRGGMKFGDEFRG